MSRSSLPTNGEVAELLRNARFELMPFESFTDQLHHLPDGATVTITASPTKGLEATIERAEEAADQGYEAVPHVAARYVRDESHAAEIAERLTAAGISDVFVPGGDREEPIGPFDSAYALLSTWDESGYEFSDVGITGYPEGHEFLDEETLAAAMQRKRPYATYITTQMCYDPETILEWIEATRERGIDLPVQVGIPGVVNYQRLLRISSRVGVGDSIRFLHKTSGVLDFLRKLVGSRGTYTPDRLVEGLAHHSGDPWYTIRGLHIYTFNQVPDTESWRQKRLQSGNSR